MPFCLLAFPPWFLRKYPEVDRALTTNQNRLTSHFDIHATLRHILYFDGGGSLSTTTAPPTVGDGKAEAISPESHRTVPLSPGNDSPYDDKQRRVLRAIPSLSPGSARSMSLFREIPRDRTCRDAGIDFQWCSCNRLEPVDSQDALVRLLAFEFALLLSDKTLRARQVCHQLNLARVRSAMKVTLAGEETPGEDKRPLDEASPGNKQFSKLLEPLGAAANRTSGRLPRQSDGEDKKPNRAIHKSSTAQTSIYLLSIETRPGGAVFEGHLQFSLSDSSVRLLGTVLRLNMFQPQSMCVKEPGLKPFCFCKDLDDKV